MSDQKNDRWQKYYLLLSIKKIIAKLNIRILEILKKI